MIENGLDGRQRGTRGDGGFFERGGIPEVAASNHGFGTLIAGNATLGV